MLIQVDLFSTPALIKTNLQQVYILIDLVTLNPCSLWRVLVGIWEKTIFSEASEKCGAESALKKFFRLLPQALLNSVIPSGNAPYLEKKTRKQRLAF